MIPRRYQVYKKITFFGKESRKSHPKVHWSFSFWCMSRHILGLAFPRHQGGGGWYSSCNIKLHGKAKGAKKLTLDIFQNDKAKPVICDYSNLQRRFCQPLRGGGYSYIWTIQGWSAEQGMVFRVSCHKQGICFYSISRISWVSCHIQGIVFHQADKQYLEQGNSAFSDWLHTQPHGLMKYIAINRVYKFQILLS